MSQPAGDGPDIHPCPEELCGCKVPQAEEGPSIDAEAASDPSKGEAYPIRPPRLASVEGRAENKGVVRNHCATGLGPGIAAVPVAAKDVDRLGIERDPPAVSRLGLAFGDGSIASSDDGSGDYQRPGNQVDITPPLPPAITCLGRDPTRRRGRGGAGRRPRRERRARALALGAAWRSQQGSKQAIPT
jgi:hypothetical protein